MFNRIRKTVAKFIAPPRQRKAPAEKAVAKAPALVSRPPLTLSRMYAAAKQSRLTTGWGAMTTSEDGEASTSLRLLRNRSRELIRDSAYAKRAKVIVQNNVVGSGIGLQAKVMTSRETLATRINDDIETAWSRWMDAGSCHTGGKLHFCDLERAALGQIFEAGEAFIRLHLQPFGESAVPLALELIEAERLADEFQPGAATSETTIVLGIEVNAFHRPVAYWFRNVHPGELRYTAMQTTSVERVPAVDVMHLHLTDRWPQTRGVPWLHAVARRLNDMEGLGEAEIVAARAAACYMGFIESPTGETQFGDAQADGSTIAELEPAQVEHLAPGEKFTYAAPNRPNSQLDPFMRLMLREVAAGVGASYESLSRDYSQSNYSSSRLALLDDRDLWRMLQSWFIRSFRMPLHRLWLRQAVMAQAIPSIKVGEYAVQPAKFEAVRFKPRGWSWVDPTKEVDAYKEAIRAGFTTVSDVIAMTGSGRDLEDVLEERSQELNMMEQMGLAFDTAFIQPATATGASPTQNEPADEPAEDDGEDPTVAEAERMLRLNTKGPIR